MLAEFDEDRVDQILDEWGLPRETESTITDRDRLFDNLDDITKRGYAIVDEEFAPGLVAVGVAVHDADETPVGGLSVGGPKYRIDMDRLHGTLAEQLLETIDSLEAMLHIFQSDSHD